MKTDYLARLKELLDRASPQLTRAYRLEYKSSFGAVAAYVNGNIFISCGRFGVALQTAPERSAGPSMRQVLHTSDISPTITSRRTTQ